MEKEKKISSKKKTIAIIDDEKLVTDSLKHLLNLETDYNILCFNDPDNAFVELSNKNFDLLICDLYIPKYDGIEYLKKIKEIYKDIPIILLTGNADKKDTIRAINEVKIFHFIQKPWDNDDLLLAIDNAIEKRDLVLTLKDKVYELEQTNDILKETQKELVDKERLSVIGQFASKIIHDLKNPVSSIAGYVSLIKMLLEKEVKEIDKINPDARIFFYNIEKEINRMIEMLKDILSFARGDEDIKLIRTDLKELIMDTIESLEYLLKKQKIDINIDYKSETSDLEIDSQKIQRVFYNLINNSIEAINNKEGKIKIIITDNENDKDLIDIEIIDNGYGISPNIKDKIFNPFFTYNKSGGTGLGLNISQKIVQKHKGKIVYNDKVKNGASFIINLPKSLKN